MSLDTAKAQVQQARQNIAQRRAEAKSARDNILRTTKRLPSRTSQQALRQKYSGMQGRTQRRQIQGAEQSLQAKEQQVFDYEQSLQDYEQTQIEPVAQQIAQIERQQSAFETARKLHQSGNIFPLNFIEDDLTRGYLKEFRQNQRFAQEFEGRLTDVINKTNTDIDLSAQEQTLFDLAERKGYLKLEEVQFQAPEIQEMQAMSVNVDRTTKLKDFSPLGFVSALGDKKKGDYTLNDTSRNISIPSRQSDRVGFFPSVGNFISDRVVGSPKSYLTKGFKEETGQVETYDPRTQTFVSASPTGTQGTAYMRQPLPGETPKFELGEGAKRLLGSSYALGQQAKEVRQYVGEEIKGFSQEQIKNLQTVGQQSKVVRDYLGNIIDVKTQPTRNKYLQYISGEVERGERLSQPALRTGANILGAVGLSQLERSRRGGGRRQQIVNYFAPRVAEKVSKKIEEGKERREVVFNYLAPRIGKQYLKDTPQKEIVEGGLKKAGQFFVSKSVQASTYDPLGFQDKAKGVAVKTLKKIPESQLKIIEKGGERREMIFDILKPEVYKQLTKDKPRKEVVKEGLRKGGKLLLGSSIVASQYNPLGISEKTQRGILTGLGKGSEYLIGTNVLLGPSLILGGGMPVIQEVQKQKYPEKGFVGGVYTSTLDLAQEGYSDIGKEYLEIKRDIGIRERRAEIKAYLNLPKVGQAGIFSEPFYYSPKTNFVGRTDLEIAEKSEKFGKGVRNVVDFGTYFTPIAPARIIGEMAEAQFSPFKTAEQPRGIVEYAKREPGDVLFLATLGVLRGGQVGVRALRKPIYDTKTFYPKTFFKKPQTTVFQPSEKVKIIDAKTTEGIGLKGVQYKVTDQVKQKVVSIAEEVTPKQVTTETNILRRFFGKKPKVIDVQKPKYTLKYFEGKGIVSKTGKEEPILSLIGKTETETAKLPGFKGARKTFEYVEVPVIKEAKEVTQSLAKVDKGFISVKGREYNLLRQKGKTTEIFRQVEKSKPTGRESEAFVEYAQGDINLRLAPKFPKKGKVSSGVSDVYIEKKVIPEEVIEGFRGGGSKSSQRYFQELYKTEEKLGSMAAEIVKPKPIKVPTPPKIVSKTVKVESLPFMVGGSGLRETPASTGAGLYEQTKTTSFIAPLKVDSISSPALKEVQEQPSIIKQTAKLLSQQQQKDLFSFKQPSVLKQGSVQKQAPVQKQSQSPVLKLLQKLSSAQKKTQTPMPGVSQSQPGKSYNPLIGKVVSQDSKSKIVKSSETQKYNVFVKRFGAWILVQSDVPSLEEAKNILRAKLLSDLSASGFVETLSKVKQKIDLGFGFRPSKINPFVQVQKKSGPGGRLGRRSEVSEINLFKKRAPKRKSKKKKNKWDWFS